LLPARPDIRFSPKIFEVTKFQLDVNEANKMAKPLQDLHAVFLEFYANHHRNVRLGLCSDLTQVESKLMVKQAGCQPKQYRLISCLTTATLLATISAAGKAGATVAALVNAVGDNELAMRGIGMLVSRKVLLRSKPPEDKEKLTLEEVIAPNPAFTSPAMKIQLPPVTREKKPDPYGVDPLEEQIRIMKKDAIECAIVRCLKQAKQMKQSELESQVVLKLAGHFRAEIPLIRSVMAEMEGDLLTRHGQGDADQIDVIYEE
jgi:hypothetical protein